MIKYERFEGEGDTVRKRKGIREQESEKKRAVRKKRREVVAGIIITGLM